MGIFDFIVGPIGRYVAAALIVAAGYAYWSRHERQAGAAAVVEKIETQNKGAANAADRAERLVRDCFDAGGVWRGQGAGHCERPVERIRPQSGGR